MYGAQLKGEPRIQEPMLTISLYVPNEKCLLQVYTFANREAAVIESQEQIKHTSILIVKIQIGARKYANFENFAKEQGYTMTCNFSNSWFETLKGSPFDETSETHEVIMKVRNMQGLAPRMPDITMYEDKL